MQPIPVSMHLQAGKYGLMPTVDQLEDFVDWIVTVVAPRFKHIILVPGA